LSELNLILLGPPGAGKGTQAERLQADFGLPLFGTGALLREAVENDTELGREAAQYMNNGDLVPDDVITGVVLEKIEEEGGDGFLLDGFPRTVAQADALEEALARGGRRLTAAIYIYVEDEEIIRRISGRRQCKQGHVYHVEFDPPKHEGVCDQDGTKLFQRDDDKPETVKKRLDTYRDNTAPLIDYYDQRGLLRNFDGSRAPTEVHDHIRATLATLRLEERL
jgi:adenylate kinase